VIAEHHIRGLQPLHIDLLNFIFLAYQGKFGQHPDQGSDDLGLPDGIFCRFIPFFVFIIHFNVHILTLLPLILYDKQGKGKDYISFS
jgi:hypothetical protein